MKKLKEKIFNQNTIETIKIILNILWINLCFWFPILLITDDEDTMFL